MKTFAKIALVALTISSVSFVGCKKGEGDPFLSLLSRKARMAGEWKVTKGEGTESQTLASITTNTTITYDGTTQTETTGSSTNTDKYTLEYTFEKDGTFTSVHTNNDANPAQVTTSTGTWNFTAGVGEEKNKSRLVMYVESVTMGSSTSSYTGDDRPTTIMDIYQLKSKEIILHEHSTSTMTNASSSRDVKWTLEPK